MSVTTTGAQDVKPASPTTIAVDAKLVTLPTVAKSSGAHDGRDRWARLPDQQNETVAAIYDQIAQELRAQYRIGFTPDKDTAAEGYHQIDLSLPRSKDLYVQTRDGYYTGK